jgi:hypothetical protein
MSVGTTLGNCSPGFCDLLGGSSGCLCSLCIAADPLPSLLYFFSLLPPVSSCYL